MKKITLLTGMVLLVTALLAQIPNSADEESPYSPSSQNASKDALVLQFNYTGIPANGSAGGETDGINYYVAKWNGDVIWRLDMTGALVDSFSIAGVTDLRDLAYDGTYFYGGNGASVIYEMNFDTTAPYLVGTIASPSVTVRNICYDPVADGFWVGNWSTDLTLVNRSGIVVSTIASTSHGMASTYGTAFDTITPGGPYIWGISAPGETSNTIITQIDVATGFPTGFTHDCTSDICITGEAGGGLWIEPDLVAGTFTLGGVIQNTSIFGYDLAGISAINENSPVKESVRVYPNPVNSTAFIDLRINKKSNVKLNVFNLIGERVITNDMGVFTKGNHTQSISVNNLNNGIYILEITIGENIITKKLIVK